MKLLLRPTVLTGEKLGTANSLDAAKGELRSAWERFYASLTPKQIEILQRTT